MTNWFERLFVRALFWVKLSNANEAVAERVDGRLRLIARDVADQSLRPIFAVATVEVNAPSRRI